ncbi:AAA family ATPase [Roseateles sp. GG27B]
MLNPSELPTSIDAMAARLREQGYVAQRELATATFLALRLQRPLFLEGEPGTGKTEMAKALAAMLGRPLIRLQCYEGLDWPAPPTSGTMRAKCWKSAWPRVRLGGTQRRFVRAALLDPACLAEGD